MNTIEEKILQDLAEIKVRLLGSKKVMNVQEAAEFLGIARSYLYKLVHWGKIPHSKPEGKIIFFDREDLEQWALSNKTMTVQERKSRVAAIQQKAPNITATSK